MAGADPLVPNSVPTGRERFAMEMWLTGIPPSAAIECSVAGQVWLKEAARLRAAYDRLRTDPRSPLGDRAEAIERLQALAAASDRHTIVRNRLRTELVARLRAGLSLAIGFEALRNGAERLAAIHPQSWDSAITINWSDATLTTSSGSVWRDVRIVSADPSGLAIEMANAHPPLQANATFDRSGSD